MERAPEKERSRAKRRAKERALERAKAKTRKVSQVENRTKIGKVFVGTVPVTPENENTHVVSNIWWVQLECPVCTAVTDGIALRKQFILASHVEVGLQVEFMSCTVYTVARCLVG